MGPGSGWRCKNCGAGEEYWTGCGIMICNVDETRARIASGYFGEIAAQLHFKGFPLDVNTVDERAFFRRPECGSKDIEPIMVMWD